LRSFEARPQNDEQQADLRRDRAVTSCAVLVERFARKIARNCRSGRIVRQD